MPLENLAAQRLIKQRLTLSTAESCSGGLLTHRLTNVSGSSKFLKLTIVAYSNEAKIKLLKVPALIIKKYGAVSAPTVQRMAQKVRALLKTDYGIAITGIAGPTGGSKAKPVGLTFIALSTPSGVVCQRHIFSGTRGQVKQKAVDAALQLLLKSLPS